MSNTTNLGDAAQTLNILTQNLNTTTITDINGQTGLPGQVLSSTALGIDWVPAGGGGTPNLQAVCTVGAAYAGTISVTGVTDCATIDNTALGTTDINSFRTNLNGFTNILKSAHSLTAFVATTLVTSAILTPQSIAVPDPDWNCIAIDIEEVGNQAYICFIVDTTGGKAIDLSALVYTFTIVSLDAYVVNPTPVVPTGFFASQVSPFEAFFLFPFSANVPNNSNWRFNFVSWAGAAI